MPNRDMAGSCERSIFSFLRNLHTGFHSDGSRLYSHQQGINLPLSPHPCQHLLSFVFLILPILTEVRLNLRLVFICIPQMAKDVDILKNNSQPFAFSSFKQYLFCSLPQILIRLFFLVFSIFDLSVYPRY